MKELKSGLAPKIKAYLEFRDAMNYAGEGERRYLASFDEYCFDHFPEETCLSKEAVRGWFFNEISQGHLALENKATSIRMFAKYLGPSAYVLPMNCVPKNNQFIPYIMTEEELESFFDAADRLSFRYDIFLKTTIPVMLRFIYACGLQPGEALRLKADDIDLKTGEIFIKNTKRHKNRIIVASVSVIAMLKKYDSIRSLTVDSTEYFFCAGDGSRIYLHQLDRSVRRCWILCHPETEPGDLPMIRAYDLRHRFASAVLQGWIDEGKNLAVMLPYLRAYMGHQSFSDTLYYIHLLPDRLMKSEGIDWERIDSIGLEDDLWND